MYCFCFIHFNYC